MKLRRIYAKKWWKHLGITEDVDYLLSYRGTRFLNGEEYVDPVDCSDWNMYDARSNARSCIHEANNTLAFRAMTNYANRTDYISSTNEAKFHALMAMAAWKESANLLNSTPDEVAVLATLGSDAAKLMYYAVYCYGRVKINERMG